MTFKWHHTQLLVCQQPLDSALPVKHLALREFTARALEKELRFRCTSAWSRTTNGSYLLRICHSPSKSLAPPPVSVCLACSQQPLPVVSSDNYYKRKGLSAVLAVFFVTADDDCTLRIFLSNSTCLLSIRTSGFVNVWQSSDDDGGFYHTYELDSRRVFFIYLFFLSFFYRYFCQFLRNTCLDWRNVFWGKTNLYEAIFLLRQQLSHQ